MSSDADAAHLEQVFLGLLVDHVDDVVDHDHALQPPVVVDDRARDQVLVAEDVRHFSLVGRRGQRRDVGIDDVEDRYRTLGAQHACRAAPSRAGDRSRIDHEDVVHVVGQVGRFAAIVDHLAHGPAVGHLDQRTLHEAAGRVFRIGQCPLSMSARSSAGISARTSLSFGLPTGLREWLRHRRLPALVRGRRNLLAVELVEDVLEHFLVEFGQGLGIEVALEDADELVALGPPRSVRGWTPGRWRSGWRAAPSTSSGLILGERRLDSPDQVRRHFIEVVDLAAHPRASARRCASTTASAVMLRMPRAVTDGVSGHGPEASVPSRIGPICRPSASFLQQIEGDVGGVERRTDDEVRRLP